VQITTHGGGERKNMVVGRHIQCDGEGRVSSKRKKELLGANTPPGHGTGHTVLGMQC